MSSVKWVSVRATIAETLGLEDLSSLPPKMKVAGWDEAHQSGDILLDLGFAHKIDLGIDHQNQNQNQIQIQIPVKKKPKPSEEQDADGGTPGTMTKVVSLRQMIEEVGCTEEVPSVFICPISLEPMQDPVTLCTGQTYERANIMQWFSIGHYVCPTTMQELWDVSLTPNRTLFHLIHKWFSYRFLIRKKEAEDVQGRVKELLDRLRRSKGQARVQCLSALRAVSQTDDGARKSIVDEGGIVHLSQLLGPFTSHVVGAEAIAILVRLPMDDRCKAALREPAKISLMIDLLHEGSMDTKINSAKLIEALVSTQDLQCENITISSYRLLFGVLKLLKDKRHPRGIAAGLSLLRIVCCCAEARSQAIGIGLVTQLVELLPCATTSCLETALAILDDLSTLSEGMDALKDCPCTIPNIVRVLMRVSENSKQHALSILWTVCKLAPEECTSTAVEAGIATKLLLVIQSSCNPVVKQRSTELLKLCSLNYTATIFISKCNLTRTIQ